MSSKWLPLASAALLLTAAGCQTVGRGLHTVPTARDYSQLEKVDSKDVEGIVSKAHQTGAQHYSPYEYFSAAAYLNEAIESRHEGDQRGMWDYSALARDMGEASMQKGGIPEKPFIVMPKNVDGAKAEFERVKALWAGLDKEKAIQVSPVLYAHATTALSFAEHEITERFDYPEGIRDLRTVEADVDTIWAQDVDGDGIVDMKDGAPWAPEDKDGFEDEDGVPDPDNDQDGILDPNDLAPNDPETKNRWHDYDGVPDSYPALESIFFSSGSSAITADARGYLRALIIILNEWPELKLGVHGHTDEVASNEFNLKLSQRRAEAVQKYLLEHGAPGDRLVLRFHGEEQPAGQSLAKNRRVDLAFE
ncbi:MAG: hypothetical protein AMXMBFR84_07210 [Candidatus Hydrogenedentota bacterium]